MLGGFEAASWRLLGSSYPSWSLPGLQDAIIPPGCCYSVGSMFTVSPWQATVYAHAYQPGQGRSAGLFRIHVVKRNADLGHESSLFWIWLDVSVSWWILCFAGVLRPGERKWNRNVNEGPCGRVCVFRDDASVMENRPKCSTRLPHLHILGRWNRIYRETESQSFLFSGQMWDVSPIRMWNKTFKNGLHPEPLTPKHYTGLIQAD